MSLIPLVIDSNFNENSSLVATIFLLPWETIATLPFFYAPSWSKYVTPVARWMSMASCPATFSFNHSHHRQTDNSQNAHCEHDSSNHFELWNFKTYWMMNECTAFIYTNPWLDRILRAVGNQILELGISIFCLIKSFTTASLVCIAQILKNHITDRRRLQ